MVFNKDAINGKILILFLCLNYLTGCKIINISNSDKYIGIWHSVENPVMTSSTLKLKKDGTFYYHLDTEWSEGLSRGNWKKVRTGIELTSDEIDTCYYVKEFGNDFIDITDSVKLSERKTTIENCIPANKSKKYVYFQKDVFYLKNDSLFHISEPNKDIPFLLNVFK